MINLRMDIGTRIRGCSVSAVDEVIKDAKRPGMAYVNAVVLHVSPALWL